MIDRLTAAGLSVVDRGDVVTEVFAVDHANSTRRNFPAVLRTARQVADEVGRVIADGAVPLVLGGDCTITLGVVAGVRRVRPDVGLFYFDGDADLATPESTSSGVLDAMGIAHLIGLTDNELANLDGRLPLLSSDRLVLFGVDETDPEGSRSGTSRSCHGEGARPRERGLHPCAATQRVSIVARTSLADRVTEPDRRLGPPARG